jgi:Phage capsid-like protein
LTIEGIRERQEWDLINSKRFGLVNSAAPSMRISTRYGAPTPDDLDELLSIVWKKPAFFLAHPKAITAFLRECTWRGVPPVTSQLFGVPIITWRGVPIIPCDKLEVKSGYQSNRWTGTTSILLLRVGEQDQGVVGLHQSGIPGEINPSLSARLMGLDSLGVASYLLTLYFSCAVLTDDALGVLENVEVGYYHDYNMRASQGFENGLGI